MNFKPIFQKWKHGIKSMRHVNISVLKIESLFATVTREIIHYQYSLRILEKSRVPWAHIITKKTNFLLDWPFSVFVEDRQTYITSCIALSKCGKVVGCNWNFIVYHPCISLQILATFEFQKERAFCVSSMYFTRDTDYLWIS